MAQINELPHDLLAEKALLVCLILDTTAFDEITDVKLEPADFYHPQYGVIYGAIFDLVSDSKPCDFVSLRAKLNDMGKLEMVGGESALLELIEDHISSASVHYYAKMIKNKSILRNIAKNSMRVTDAAINFVGNVEEFIDEVEGSFFSITSQSRTNFVKTLKESLKENLQKLEEGGRGAGEISGLTSGFPSLDRKFLGLQPGQMIIIAARPGVGKTSLVLNMAVNMCKLQSLPVVFYSYEMLNVELSGRMLSAEANIDSRKIRTKEYNEMDLRNMFNAVKVLSKLPIFINDNSGTTLLDIKSQCRKIKSEHGLGLIVIDYLQLMKPHVRKQSREQEIAEISRGIKELAKELGCPIIALSQLNRSAMSRTDRRPQLQDLRESGSIEQDADIVCLIHREDVVDPNSPKKGIAEVIVAKNRAGEQGTVELAWVGSQTKFAELSRSQENE